MGDLIQAKEGSVGTASIVRRTGFTTSVDSTILSSGFSSGDNPRGVEWDGTNLISVDATDRKIFLHDEFTTTALSTLSYPDNILSSVTWDGTDLYWSTDITLDNPKIVKNSGFTSTILNAGIACPYLPLNGSDTMSGLSWAPVTLDHTGTTGSMMYLIGPWYYRTLAYSDTILEVRGGPELQLNDGTMYNWGACWDNETVTPVGGAGIGPFFISTQRSSGVTSTNRYEGFGGTLKTSINDGVSAGYDADYRGVTWTGRTYTGYPSTGASPETADETAAALAGTVVARAHESDLVAAAFAGRMIARSASGDLVAAGLPGQGEVGGEGFVQTVTKTDTTYNQNVRSNFFSNPTAAGNYLLVLSGSSSLGQVGGLVHAGPSLETGVWQANQSLYITAESVVAATGCFGEGGYADYGRVYWGGKSGTDYAHGGGGGGAGLRRGDGHGAYVAPWTFAVGQNGNLDSGGDGGVTTTTGFDIDEDDDSDNAVENAPEAWRHGMAALSITSGNLGEIVLFGPLRVWGGGGGGGGANGEETLTTRGGDGGDPGKAGEPGDDFTTGHPTGGGRGGAAIELNGNPEPRIETTPSGTPSLLGEIVP